MPFSSGDVIDGKYRIENPLGEGGMGRVYVATHGILRKQVAVKVMAERFRVDADAVERFFREAVAASKVDHPAIVQVFDAGVHRGAPYMAMELLEGEDLDQKLAREQRISLEETLRIARPVLSALEAAHAVGVVHRDIKPPNIFLARRANGIVTPKLLDFGIAKHLNDPHFDRLTQSGSVLGTPLYLAPEQARADADIDHRADIYSFGVTLFHCLSGTTPYTAKTFAELIGKMFSTPPPPLAELAPDVPPAVCAWIDRCLSRERELRPETARALLTGLDEAYAASLPSHSPAAFAKTAEQDPPTPPAPAQAPPTQVKPLLETPAHAPPTAAPVLAAPSLQTASAWSVAGTEPAVDPAPARSGRPLFVLGTLFVVAAAVVGAGVMFAGGGPGPSSPSSDESPAPPPHSTVPSEPAPEALPSAVEAPQVEAPPTEVEAPPRVAVADPPAMAGARTEPAPAPADDLPTDVAEAIEAEGSPAREKASPIPARLRTQLRDHLRADRRMRECTERFGRGRGEIEVNVAADGRVSIVSTSGNAAIDCYAQRIREVELPRRLRGRRVLRFPL